MNNERYEKYHHFLESMKGNNKPLMETILNAYEVCFEARWPLKKKQQHIIDKWRKDGRSDDWIRDRAQDYINTGRKKHIGKMILSLVGEGKKKEAPIKKAGGTSGTPGKGGGGKGVPGTGESGKGTGKKEEISGKEGTGTGGGSGKGVGQKTGTGTDVAVTPKKKAKPIKKDDIGTGVGDEKKAPVAPIPEPEKTSIKKEEKKEKLAAPGIKPKKLKKDEMPIPAKVSKKINDENWIKKVGEWKYDKGHSEKHILSRIKSKEIDWNKVTKQSGLPLEWEIDSFKKAMNTHFDTPYTPIDIPESVPTPAPAPAPAPEKVVTAEEDDWSQGWD